MDPSQHNPENSVIITIPTQADCSNYEPDDKNAHQIACLICYETFSKDEFCTILSCKHMICKGCFNGYVDSKIQSFQVMSIHCPQEGCSEILNDNDLQSALDENIYSRYQELVLKKMINRNSSGRLCPKPGCSRPIKLKKKNLTGELSCTCGARICGQCLNLVHPDKSCLQNLDPQFESYANDNEIRFCMMCKTPVAREEGCNHMTCCVCDYEWCWACGKQIGRKHSCSGSWDPSGSNGYRSNIKRSIRIVLSKLATFCKVLLKILVLPFLVFYYIILWPYVLYKKSEAEAREAEVGRSYRSQNGCLEPTLLVIMGIFLFPLTVIAVIVSGLCDLPGTLKKLKAEILSNNNDHQSQTTKRWMAGKIDNFKYTEKARPTHNATNANIG